jgi:hypothetical protein
MTIMGSISKDQRMAEAGSHHVRYMKPENMTRQFIRRKGPLKLPSKLREFFEHLTLLSCNFLASNESMFLLIRQEY